jgi:hypothetical protein
VRDKATHRFLDEKIATLAARRVKHATGTSREIDIRSKKADLVLVRFPDSYDRA